MNSFKSVFGGCAGATVFAIVAPLCLIGGCIFIAALAPKSPQSTATPAPTQQSESAAPAKKKITLADFNAIQNGWTYQQVKLVLGEGVVQSENTLAGIHTIMYTWANESFLDGNCNAMFQNDKLISKAQIGLK